MVREGGVNTTTALTCTVEVAVAKPFAVAVIFAAPNPVPVIIGWEAGAVWPVAMVTVPVDRVTLLESLLAKVMVTGAAAGDARVTGKLVVTPNPNPPLAGRLMVPVMATVTL